MTGWQIETAEGWHRVGDYYSAHRKAIRLRAAGVACRIRMPWEVQP